jgi:predicted ATP-grasp superfamily ATP-dependent carboligase
MPPIESAGNDSVPVYILNMSYTGLGIARNLYGTGVRTVGLTAHSGMPGAHTRLCAAIYQVPDSRDEPDALCQRLLELAKNERQSIIVFPTRDFDILFLENYRHLLEPKFIIPQPGMEVINQVMNKFTLAQIAHHAGCKVPATFRCANIQGIESILTEIGFPAVVKPCYASHWRQQGVWDAVGSRKAFLVHSREELLDEYHRISAVQPEIILQEFIPGHDSEIVVCCCHIGRSQEMLGYFTARKLIQSPALFGTGCVVEACDVPEVVTQTRKLLHTCNYTGIAEVEYKLNPQTGEYYLIEINPRHWDQHELGTKLGVNLTWIAYNDIAFSSQIFSRPTYNGRIAWVAEREFCFELMHLAFQSNGSIRTIGNFLRRRYLFATFRTIDPKPGFYMLKNIFIEICMRLWNSFVRIFGRSGN